MTPTVAEPTSAATLARRVPVVLAVATVLLQIAYPLLDGHRRDVLTVRIEPSPSLSPEVMFGRPGSGVRATLSSTLAVAVRPAASRIV